MGAVEAERQRRAGGIRRLGKGFLAVVRHPVFVLATCAFVFGLTAIGTWGFSPAWLAMPKLWAVVSGLGAVSCLAAMTRHHVAVAAAGSLVVVAAATRGTAIIIDWLSSPPTAEDAAASWAISGLTWLGVSVWLLNVWADRITRWASRR